jgi:hypothetical protein
MSPTTNLQASLSKIGAMANDEQAVDELVELLAATPAADPLEEEGDEIPEVTGLVAFSGEEFDIKHQEFVTNPAATWDFAKPVSMLFPHSLKGVVNAVRYAEENHLKVKGLGSRHSFSLAPATDHCYIDLSKTFTYSLSKHNETVHSLDQSSLDLLKDGVNKKQHFDALGGLTIRMINHILCPDTNNDIARFGRKRMFNMGGGDVQTFAGAFSTGTHGSGGKYSAYHDMIRSILLVSCEGKVYRIEPTNGITDPDKHQLYYNNHPEKVNVLLIQDDDKFYSLLVSMGCFGIIYSAIIEIAEMTLLHADNYYYKSGWSTNLKQTLQKPVLPADPEEEYFYYIQLNPYKLNRKKNPSILVKEIKPSNVPGSGKKETRRKIWPSVFANWPLSVNLIRHITNSGLMPKKRIIESALRSQNDNTRRGRGYTDIAYKIWNAGSGKTKSIGTGIEIAFPAEEAPEAIDLLLACIEKVSSMGRGYYLNAPIALRFVRPSKAYLAPNYHTYNGKQVGEWCYVEILRVNSKAADDDKKELEIFTHLQTMMYLKGGRPHWGLNFGFPFTTELLHKLYPKFNEWLAAYRFFNFKGTFENEFTRKAGLDQVLAPIV